MPNNGSRFAEGCFVAPVQLRESAVRSSVQTPQCSIHILHQVLRASALSAYTTGTLGERDSEVSCSGQDDLVRHGSASQEERRLIQVGVTETVREITRRIGQRGVAMEPDSSDSDVLPRPRSCSSSSTSESEISQEDADYSAYYDFPMDLSKKSPRSPDSHSSEKECEKEMETAPIQRSIHPAAHNPAWRNVFVNSLPALAGAGAFQRGHKVPLTFTAGPVDVGKPERAPAISAKKGAELYATRKTYQNDKENPCLYTCGTKNGCVCCDAVLDLQEEPSKQETPVQDSSISGSYMTEKDPKAILIRFLASRALSAEKQQQYQTQWEDADTPEDLSPQKNLPPHIEKYRDQEAKRAASCTKLFAITSESLVERLKRVRCKSDSEIESSPNINSSYSRRASDEGSASPPPWDQRSSPQTPKRRVLGGITSPDSTVLQDEASCKQPRICVESVSKPGSRPCSPTCDQRAPGDTLFQQMRQLAPAALPLSTYAYHTQIMQRLYEHELLKRHLEGMASSGALLSKLSSPSALASAMAPCLEQLEEPNGIGPAAGSHIDLYTCAMRKRASRALTGKHVKHGTGASTTTLLTLRQKIQERQRARQLGIMETGVRPLKGDRARKAVSKGASNGKKPTLNK